MLWVSVTFLLLGACALHGQLQDTGTCMCTVLHKLKLLILLVICHNNPYMSADHQHALYIYTISDTMCGISIPHTVTLA